MNDLTAHDQARIALARAMQQGTDPELYDTIADTAIQVAAGCDERTLLRLTTLVGLIRDAQRLPGPVDQTRATFDERHTRPVPEYRTMRRDPGEQRMPTKPHPPTCECFACAHARAITPAGGEQ